MIYERISEYTEIETYDDGNICIIQYDDKYVELNMKELANIPQVKNLLTLIDDWKHTLDVMYDFSDEEIEDYNNAFAPFKCLPGDNEND